MRTIAPSLVTWHGAPRLRIALFRADGRLSLRFRMRRSLGPLFDEFALEQLPAPFAAFHPVQKFVYGHDASSRFVKASVLTLIRRSRKTGANKATVAENLVEERRWSSAPARRRARCGRNGRVGGRRRRRPRAPAAGPAPGRSASGRAARRPRPAAPPRPPEVGISPGGCGGGPPPAERREQRRERVRRPGLPGPERQGGDRRRPGAPPS